MKGILTSLENGSEIPLTSVTMVGRSNECNLLVADTRVSRRHAMIRKQEDGYWLFDLGSFNGSHINGNRVTAARLLQDNDIINFADHEFRFNLSGMVSVEQNLDTSSSTVALIRSKTVIVLVSDIQGFTSLSEKLAPGDLAQVIGGWYSDCELILGKYGATVDKFIGDCVLAYWPLVNEVNLTKSVLAARDLLGSCRKIYELKREVFESIGQKFGAGVAMHTGKVAYGGMSHGEFTLIGDPVNLTFRIESLTRTLGHEILASREFIDASPELRQYAENLGIHTVKGRGETVEVWGFHSFPEPPAGLKV